MPDTAPKTIRQPGRLECGNDVQIHETVIRARGVAKGPPSVTSENQRWRPGARRQSALADWPGMSVRHSARAGMIFVNGNREWMRGSYWLSTRSASRTGEQCSANKHFVERSELTLLSESQNPPRFSCKKTVGFNVDKY
jgi:hypothetical protein